jgi:peroxiredoxin
LLLWLAPEYGFQDTHVQMAMALNRNGMEVWHVDLHPPLFLTPSPDAMREFSGQYVADLIEQAYEQTGKHVTLVSSWYAAIPTLRGARVWQERQPRLSYLSGALLFSPSLYQGVPALGHDARYLPVVQATNIPLAILQASDANNRWYLDSLLDQLHSAGSPVYTVILSGVRDLFYFQEHLDAEASIFRTLPGRIQRIVQLLDKTPTPLTAAALPNTQTNDKHLGLNDKLKSYNGHVIPRSFQLPTVEGDLFTIDDYKGKVTVLNFWATWCPPCVEEIPSLNRLRQTMSDEAFDLLSINYAETPEAIHSFLEKINVDFPVLIDAEGQESARWKVFTLPSTFVIGPNGSIQYGVNAAIEWDSPEVIQSLKEMMEIR